MFRVKAVDEGGLSSSIIKTVIVIPSTNIPPVMRYAYAITQTATPYIIWGGYDEEQGYRGLRYQYQIDGGAWSAPTYRTYAYFSELGISTGKHIVRVKVIDEDGAESAPMAVETMPAPIV